MSKPTARLGDKHEGICDHGSICCPHNVTGTIIEGSSSIFVNGKPIARKGDKVIHDCPHCGTGYINVGSSTVHSNVKPTARIGDEVIYPGGKGVIIEGSPNVFTGD